MSDNFYKEFEDKFRGSRDLIKERLAIYLPFITPLLEIYPQAKALDIGCGRGEWLEILNEHNFISEGIDLDDGMMAECHKRGLNVSKNEGVAYLKSVPDNSHVVITGFHITEHIPFANLQELVQESLRILVPAGILILETPNAENIGVGTVSFYEDPTHIQPLPSSLLSFLTTYYGFNKTKILGLQHDKNILDKTPSIMTVLAGVSPDYSVIAQKAGSNAALALTAPAFDLNYGVDLAKLAIYYDNSLDNKINQAMEKSNQAMEKSNQAMEKSNQAIKIIAEIYASRSWRITAPLRFIASIIRKIYYKTLHLCKYTYLKIKQGIKYILRWVFVYVRTSPRLKLYALWWYNYLPFLQSLTAFLIQPKLPESPIYFQTLKKIDIEQLNPHAKKIYACLVVKIDTQELS